jgi:hypothetical protein
MPITVRLEEHLIHATLTGPWPTLPEIIAERSKLILSGAIRPGAVELIDARGVTKGIPNLSQMQAILHAISKPPDKRAIVVTSNVQFGAARLAEALDPKALKVFRDEESARKWLLGGDDLEQPVQFERSGSGKIAVVKNR